MPDAGLRYIDDRGPGITRRRAGKGFVYARPDGAVVKDEATLARIRRLAIPPAWTEVWIAPDPRAHLQATGRDARGRKQYRYHPDWVEMRGKTKFDRMLAFGRALPRIRRRVARDLRRKGMPREKVLAAVVHILDETGERVGNDEYARTNSTYGLTTMRNGHAEVKGARIRLRYRGKGAKMREAEIEDPRVAHVVRRCQDLPGQELFAYVDEEGAVRDVTSTDVNAYIRAISGGDFTAKDFRTWGATCLAVEALRAMGAARDASHAGRNFVEAVKLVATRIGNTPTVCRKSYVHPAVAEAYAEGVLLRVRRVRRLPSLTEGEAAVVWLLARRQREGDDLVPALARSVARATAAASR